MLVGGIVLFLERLVQQKCRVRHLIGKKEGIGGGGGIENNFVAPVLSLVSEEPAFFQRNSLEGEVELVNLNWSVCHIVQIIIQLLPSLPNTVIRMLRFVLKDENFIFLVEETNIILPPI